MKKMKIVLTAVAVMSIVATSAFATGIGDEAGSATLAFSIEGPGRWQPGGLNRVLIELTPVDGQRGPVRVALPVRRDYEVIRGVAPGTYEVTMARFGLPDGSFTDEVTLPQTRIVVAGDGVTVAPIRLVVAGDAPREVTWLEMTSDESSAVALMVAGERSGRLF